VIPQLRDWHARYAEQGLTIVGVHSPEFSSERSLERVKAAVDRHGIRYPVVQDNDFVTWRRYGVRAWPTAVLIDRQGRIRFRHIGEGRYEETERVIRALLAER
jgi:peroxiredoxin